MIINEIFDSFLKYLAKTPENADFCMTMRHKIKQFRSLAAVSIVLFSLQACQQSPLFREISSEKSGIDFSNTISESAELSVLNYEYIYNGGGVGVGDFNNDSLPDIYFTGNMVSNALYINKGDLKFQNITKEAGVDGQGKWNKGVSIIDINNDGWMDIYVCSAVYADSNARKNILYINQGINQQTGLPYFKDEAAAYGLDHPSNTQMAAFFDYDNDGDLDVYLLLNDLDGTYPNEFRPIRKDGSWPNTDKLLENHFDSSLHHPVYTDVSAKSGILIEGHGLGISIADINQDGWKDIYVSNDYLSNNILYINNKNGTFTDQCNVYFKHTSKNAMGNDIADINNDGLPDVIEMDMMPADQYRQKLMHSDISYQNFQNSERFGYMYQYPRNTLQLNRGKYVKENTKEEFPSFSEIAYLSGVAQTDWSWAPLLIDADNDGYRDLMISNGLPRDMSDMDFMAYRRNAYASTPLEEVLKQIPAVKISNYFFKNNGDLSFSDKTNDWGWQTSTFSAGMAYADFDRDGDVDVVINNTNMKASLLENTLNQQKEKQHYINIQLIGNNQNIHGLGAMIHVYTKDKHQFYEQSPYRGYLSSVEPVAHFGIGNTLTIDSIQIIWPNQTTQVIKNVEANQTITLNIKDAGVSSTHENKNKPLFSEITNAVGMDKNFAEIDFIDFDIQKLIPHKLTKYGPSIAIGDLNNDGLDDFIAGGSSPFYASIFIQQKNGKFNRSKLTDSNIPQLQDDAGLLLLDADGDKDLDLYIASGGAENEPQSKAYTDHFYLNDGNGKFKEEMLDITNNRTAKSCIAACDYDNDGDLDMFIGGRVVPGSYPSPTSSFIYQNESSTGKVFFRDITKTIAPELFQLGMVTSAVWSDVDNDGKKDLAIAMDWGGITFFKNDGKQLKKISTNISDQTGWWNSIVASDVDNDGDMDYIVGNYGYNGFLQPSKTNPINGYANDFDNNGSFDAVFSSFRKSAIYGPIKEFPLAGRDEFIRQMTIMKEKFTNYATYAKTEMNNIFPEDAMKNALKLSVNNFYTSWIENKGNFQFEMHQLPTEAQIAPVYGIVANDFNEDGNIDIALNGNEYNMSPALGRYDGFKGLILLGDGKGHFEPMTLKQSGIHIDGNGKSLGEIFINNQYSLIGSQNEGSMKIYSLRQHHNSIAEILPTDSYGYIHLKNGKKRKIECIVGQGFLTQSSSKLMMNPSIAFIEMIDRKGNHRKIIHDTSKK